MSFVRVSLATAIARHIQPDTVSINICIHACDRQWEHSLQLFAYLERHLRPSVVSYGALFTSLGSAHKWLQVLALLQQMPMQNPSKMQILFNTSLGAFKDSHRWDLALELFNNLETNQFKILDEVGWGAVIAACAKGSQWQTALLLLRTSHLLRVCNTLQTYNWLLKGLKQKGHWGAGLAILQDAIDKRLQPNGVSFSNLFQMWRNSGHWHQVLMILEQLRSSNVQEDAEVLTSILAALERNHRLNESRRAINSVKSSLYKHLQNDANPTSTELHETMLLYDAWVGAGLPDVFGNSLSRRFGAPMTAAVLQGASASVKGHLLRNVHSLNTLHARLVAECATTASAGRKKNHGLLDGPLMAAGTSIFSHLAWLRPELQHIWLQSTPD